MIIRHGPALLLLACSATAALGASPPLPEHVMIQFGLGSTKLDGKANSQISKLVENINQRPASEVTVMGYSDTMGSEKVNLAISKKRAQTVADTLKKKKAKMQSISVEAHGKSSLLVPTPDNTAEGRNRRVEVMVR